MLPSPQFASYQPTERVRSGFAALSSGCAAGRASIIGSSPALLNALEQARQAARSDADILLEAESGTGKELLARLIHDGQPPCLQAVRGYQLRRGSGEPAGERTVRPCPRALSPERCRAMPASLSWPIAAPCCWTRSAKCRCRCSPSFCGCCRSANFIAWATCGPFSVDVRVIASTNRSLQVLVLEGRFREDLYYRLNVIPLGVPPLRERGDDVIELAEYFAAKFAAPAPPPS